MTVAVDPIRVLAVHHGGGVGGAPISLLRLLAALDPAAFEARALFTEHGSILDFARTLGVPASVVPTGGSFFYSAHARLGPRSVARFLRTFPMSVAAAQRTLEALRPDVLHLNTSVLLAWAAAARRVGVPVVWMVREVLGPNPVLRRWHAAYILRHARRVVAISDAVTRCFPVDAPVERIYNAVDLSDFSHPSREDRARARAHLGLATDDFVIAALGSVQRAKGHWLLLDAFEQVLARRPSSRLVLVCGGVDDAYRASTRGRVKRALGLPLDNLDALLRLADARGFRDQVLITGFRQDVPGILPACDVVAFLSLEPEGFGRPLIEAMAAGVPVVATRIGPTQEVVGPSAGALVEPSAGAVAATLLELAAQPATRASMGEAGRRRVERLFTLDRQVAAMQDVYREAAGRG